MGVGFARAGVGGEEQGELEKKRNRLSKPGAASKHHPSMASGLGVPALFELLTQLPSAIDCGMKI